MDNQNTNSGENQNKDADTNKQNDGTFKIIGDWKAQSEVLKGKFPQLTDSDLKYEQGQEIDLLKRVETKLNKGRNEVINIIRKGNIEKS